jgi:hypothetical protein
MRAPVPYGRSGWPPHPLVVANCRRHDFESIDSQRHHHHLSYDQRYRYYHKQHPAPLLVPQQQPPPPALGCPNCSWGHHHRYCPLRQSTPMLFPNSNQRHHTYPCYTPLLTQVGHPVRGGSDTVTTTTGPHNPTSRSHATPRCTPKKGTQREEGVTQSPPPPDHSTRPHDPMLHPAAHPRRAHSGRRE